MADLKVAVRVLPNGAGLELPAYQSSGAAGLDLVAAIGEGEEIILAPGCRVAVPCGFAMHLPDGYEAQIRPRSGVALRHGVTVLNAPGTIDSDYRGEIVVILVNLGLRPLTIARGLRIAQMVVAPVVRAVLDVVEDLEETDRGAGGFGSTGTGAVAAE